MLSHPDLVRLIAEAAPSVKGGAVHRVWRAGDDTFVFLLRLEPRRHGREAVALEIGLVPEGARVLAATEDDVGAHDPAEKKARKEDGHPFLVRLRRVLGGCTVEGLSVRPDDRIAVLDLARPAAAGQGAAAGEPDADEPRGPARPLEGRDATARPRLVVELTGRATNLVLVDRGPGPELGDSPEIASQRDRIVASLRPGRGARSLEPGERYAFPAPWKPREGSSTSTSTGAGEAGEVFQADLEPDPGTLELSRAFRDAAILAEDSLEERARYQELLKAARRGLSRAQGLIQKLENERKEALEAEDLRQRGELLKANAGLVKKGMTSVRVLNFFSMEQPQPEIEIELDPLEPVMDQARALFKRAKKLDRGLVAIETRLGAADGEAQDLTAVVAALEGASPEDTTALDQAEKKLQKLGCAPRPVAAPEGKPKKKPDAPRGPRHFVTRDGFDVLVGRSNTENDHLTIRMANGNDLFFHVRGFPGSHVIVRAQRDKSVPLETLLDAAALAVHYSKVRGNTRADVSYTPRKFVRKPRGAKPGLVEISNEKTIRPDGDPARLARLLATAGGDAKDDGSEDFS